MNEKYYVFFLDEFDDMQEISFKTETELHDWIMETYPDLTAFEESDIRIVYGYKVNIEIEEVQIIKKIKTAKSYVGGL